MVSSRTHLSKLRIPSSVSGGDAAQLFQRKQVLTLGLAVALFVSNLVGVFPAQATGTCAPEVTGSLAYTAVQVDNDCVVSFTGGSGTWTPEYAGDIWLLMVAGGGSGGGTRNKSQTGGGGGGAGEYFESLTQEVEVAPIDISIGRGGAKTARYLPGNQGGDTVFGQLTTVGGGGGGFPSAGGSGGSGGGGSAWGSGGVGGASIAVIGLGFAGGDASLHPRDEGANSAGGGGAGGPGEPPEISNGSYVNPGAGGPGVSSLISGTSVTYSKGGDGAAPTSTTTTVANPGIGYGGNGNNGPDTTSLSEGSNGVVVVRYSLAYPTNEITFQSQGGLPVSTETRISGFAIQTEPVTSLDNRLFLGWFDAASGGSRVAFPFTPEADQTLFAQWAEYSTITFDSDGGSSVSSEDVVSGSALTTISEPVRANHQFLGWFDAPSGGSLVEFPWIPTVDITLHARWIETFEVDFDSQGGSSMVSLIAVSGSPITTLSHPVRVGYSFLGWFDQSSGGTEVAMPFSPSADQELFAQWIHGAIAGIPPEDLPTPAVLPINSGLTSTRYEAALDGVAASSVVFIPAGALPIGASVKIYTMTNTDFLDTQISSNYSYLVTQIVSWTAADGTVPLASASISMTITDPQIKAGSRVFKVMNQVSTEIAVATEDGRVVIEFVEDPLLTVAATEPDAPFSVSVASTGASSAVVEWLAPLISGGGGAITYTATSGNGQSCTSSGLSCTVSGLESETSYSFTVTAANSIGVSPTSQASTEIQTGAAIPSVAAEPRPFTYAGPSVTSTPLRAASAGEIVQIIGEKLDLVTEVKISGVSLVLTKQEEGSIEFLLPSTTPIGIADLVIYSGLGKLVYVSFLEITQATEIEAARSDSVNQRLNAGAFNGFAAVYAKGFVGKTLSWQIGGRWFRQAITNDYQVFLRKAGQVGGSYTMRMFIDGEEMFAKTLATR